MPCQPYIDGCRFRFPPLKKGEIPPRRFSVDTALVRLLFICLTVGACGPGIEEGPLLQESQLPSQEDGGPNTAGADTGDSDTDTRTDADAGADTETVTTLGGCDDDVFEEKTLIAADAILTDGEFVALGRNCLLATVSDGTESHIAVTFANGQHIDFIEKTIEETFPGTPRAISCQSDIFAESDTAVVVMETETGSLIVEGNKETGEWRTLLETAASFRGVEYIFRTEYYRYEKLCVYGEGIYCTEMAGDHLTWTEIHAPDEHPFTDMTLIACGDAWCEVAVGPGGLVDIRKNGLWERKETGVEVDLLTASNTLDRFIAAGDDGVVILGTAETTPKTYTLFEDKRIVSLYFLDPTADMIIGNTADGMVFQAKLTETEAVLCPNIHALSTQAIAGTFFKCEDADNYVVADPSALVGAFRCTTIILNMHM